MTLKIIRTQRQVCVYIDILGGAELYNNKDKRRAQGFFECVKEFERRLNGWTHHFPARRHSEALVKTFSDNLVAAFPFNSNPNLNDSALLGLVLSELRHQLYELTILAGFPVRGAVTVGQLMFTDRLLYGPALVEAVQLEKEALFPRVLISPKALKCLNAEDAARYVVRDRDGKDFLHYLDNEWHCQWHRKFVVKGLRENSGRVHERQKYEWLAQYHNFSARNIGRPEFCVELERADAFRLGVDEGPETGVARRTGAS